MASIILPFLVAICLVNEGIAGPLTQRALTSYQLQDYYNYTNFFDAFEFFTDNDPTNGFINYVSREVATQKGYISADSVNNIRMRVDDTTVITDPNSVRGRDSVRISSIKSYTRGMTVGDFQHMPGSICGSWPAFWMLGPNWPSHGEIDIIEGISMNTMNLMSLHSADNCTVSTQQQQGTVNTQNCYIYAADQTLNAGCGSMSVSTDTYGDGFNANGGGVWAVEWTTQFIKIWFFRHGREPADLLSNIPDPTSNSAAWGTPQAWFQGSCDIGARFADQNIIFDITFCGDYAGNDYVWGDLPADHQSACAVSTGYPNCRSFVAARAADFAETYWEVNYLKYFAPAVAEPTTSSTFSLAVSSITSSSTTSLSTTSSTISSSTLSSSITSSPTTSSSTTSSSTTSSMSSSPSSTTSLLESFSTSVSSTISSPTSTTSSTLSSSIESSFGASSTSSSSSSSSQALTTISFSLPTSISQSSLSSISSSMSLIRTTILTATPPLPMYTSTTSAPTSSTSVFQSEPPTVQSPSSTSLLGGEVLLSGTQGQTPIDTSSSSFSFSDTGGPRGGTDSPSTSTTSTLSASTSTSQASDSLPLPSPSIIGTSGPRGGSGSPSLSDSGTSSRSPETNPVGSSPSSVSGTANSALDIGDTGSLPTMVPAPVLPPGFGLPGQVIVNVITTATYCPYTCVPQEYTFPTDYPTNLNERVNTYTYTFGSTNLGVDLGSPGPTIGPTSTGLNPNSPAPPTGSAVIIEPPTGMGGSSPGSAIESEPPTGTGGLPLPAVESEPPTGMGGSPLEPAIESEPPTGMAGSPPGPAVVNEPPTGMGG